MAGPGVGTAGHVSGRCHNVAMTATEPAPRQPVPRPVIPQAVQALRSRPATPALLGFYHETFDALTGKRSCEAKLRRDLLKQRVTGLVGPMGSGKTSVIEYVLGPDSEGAANENSLVFLPIVFPVRDERMALLTDPREFVEQLSDAVRDAAQRNFAGDSTFVKPKPRTRRRSSRKMTLAPTVATPFLQVRLELGDEVFGALSDDRPSSRERLAELRSVLQLVRDRGLEPVLVFDDLVQWFGSPAGGVEARTHFWRQVPSALADSLAVAAVLTIEPQFLDDAFDSAGDIVERIEVPRVPDAAGLARILDRRIRFRAGPGYDHSSVLTAEALQLLYEHYAAGIGSIRRDVLRPLELALDPDAGAGRLAPVTADQMRTVLARR